MEQQIWDRRWENGYCFPFRNAETGRYYARDIYDGSIIPTSYSKSLRELRRKVRGYVSENLIQREKWRRIYDMATRKELTSYFPHDSNARNSDKLIRLRMRHKAAGYGVYFMILERLREEPEYTSVKDYNMIAFDLREDTSLIKSVVEDFGLFVFTDDGKYFYSESFKQRMEIKDEQSRKKAEAGKKGLEKRWGNSKNIANAIENDSNKRKEKESKEKYPPPLSPAGGNGGCGNNLFSKDSNTDGIERNFEGLTNRLNRLFIPPDEFNIICQLSNNGEIGHPIWTIIQAAERGGARLHSPGKYIISELKKAIKK